MLAAVVLVLGIAATPACSLAATVVVSDTFSASDGTAITSHSPDVNLPGGAYGLNASNWPLTIVGNRARMGSAIGGGISIQPWNGEGSPAVLTISANLNLGTLTASGWNHGEGLGFFNAVDASGVPYSRFTGLQLNTDGDLRLIVDGGNSGQSVAYSGTFDAGVDHALSYTVNTGDGSISEVVLDGAPCSFTTTAFTPVATAYAGFYANADAGGMYGYLDDLLVTGVLLPAPEGIVIDTFSALDGTALTGHSPDVNLPGGAYGLNASGWPLTIVGNRARMGAAIGGGISIQSSGTYTKPSVLAISADLNLGTLVGGSWNNGIGLGFFSSLASGGGPGERARFTGLRMGTDGELRLIVDGGNSGQSVAYSGTFDPAANHSLSYKVRTASGSIADVVLDGTPCSFATAGFTDAATAYGGFFGSSGAGGTYSYVDNFKVTLVPPHGTVILIE